MDSAREREADRRARDKTGRGGAHVNAFTRAPTS